MSKKIPSLLSWDILSEGIKSKPMQKTASKKLNDSDYDGSGNRKQLTDSGGQDFHPRKGLEGPFLTKGTRKAYYYDPKEGKHWCPYGDVFIDGDPSAEDKDTRKKASSSSVWEAALLGKESANWVIDEDMQNSDIRKGYEEGDPVIMGLYDSARNQDGEMHSLVESAESEDKQRNIEIAYKEAFWKKALTLGSHSSVKSSSHAYDALCKNSSNKFTLTVIAKSENEAFSKVSTYVRSCGLDWKSTEVELTTSASAWAEDLKTALHRHEIISLSEAVKKIIESRMKSSPSNEAMDEPSEEVEESGKISVLIGQIATIMNVMNQVTGEELKTKDVLDALAREATSHKADLELGGNPMEAYLLFNPDQLIRS